MNIAAIHAGIVTSCAITTTTFDITVFIVVAFV